MLTQLKNLLRAMLSSVRDLVPIVAVIAFFQIVVLQQAPSELAGLLGGALCVVAGLTFFIAGLEMALFPLGETMAGAFLEKGSLPALLAFAFALGFGTTVAEPALIAVCAEAAAHWLDYGWVYAFAIGFGTTIAEPSLIAVAIKASSVSGGSIGVWGLRIAVALGVALGIALGAWRIVTGAPIHWFIIVGYVRLIQTSRAPDRAARLRLIRRDHLHRHRAARGRPRSRPRGDRAGTQSAHRRLRAHRLRESLPHHQRDGLRPALGVSGAPGGSGGAGDGRGVTVRLR